MSAFSAACTDATLAPASTQGGPVSLALRPSFHLLGSSSQLAPINLARLTVLNAATRERIAGPFTIVVNPSDPVFNLPVTFDVPGGSDRIEIVVSVELLNLTDGVETIEWSGITSPISVTAGSSARPSASVELFQGPPGNLAVTAVDIIGSPSSLTEGQSAQLTAVAQGNPNARIFWQVTNSDVATIDDSGTLRTLRNGVVSVIASAGPRSDTVTINVGARVVAVRISPDNVQVASLGEEIAVSAVAIDPRGAPVAGQTFTWSSQNGAVLASLGNGRFTSVANGTTGIQATLSGTGTAGGTGAAPAGTATVVVRQRVASVTLDLGGLELTAVGDRRTFLATAKDARSNTVANAPLTWSSSNPAVVSVDGSGGVVANAVGSATITATSADGPAATASVAVQQTVATLTLSPGTMNFDAIGETAPIGVVARDRNNNVIAAPVLAWSATGGAASVDGAGVVRSVARGTSVVTAAAGGVRADVTVRVAPVAVRVTVTPGSATLTSLNSTAAFAAHAFDRRGNEFVAEPAWSSTNPAVATVSDAGVATAVGNGSADIVATVNGITGAGSLVVRQTVARLVAAQSSIVLAEPGQTAHVVVTAQDAAGRPVTTPALTYSSSNPAIASVDGSGGITALRYGGTSITVSDGTNSVSVDVEVATPTMLLSPDPVEFTSVGQTRRATAVFQFIDGREKVVAPVWSSSNRAVATVSEEDGVITATGVGDATITATLDGVTAALHVVVAQSASPGFLTGRVVDAATNAPLANASITFNGAGGSFNASTDDAGLFTSPAMPALSFNMSVSRSGYQTTTVFDVTVVQNTTTPVGSIPLVPASTQTGAISGVVRDARNTGAITGATVSLRAGLNATDGPIVATVLTGQGGSFSFTGLASGVYSLSASAPGYASGVRGGIVLGGTTRSNQDITLSPAGTADDWRIVLTWDASPSDLDSHLTGPLGGTQRFHVAYYDHGSLTSSPFAQLDVDDTSGFGPETISISTLLAGPYRYSVHNYSSAPAITTSNARVEVYHGSSRVAVFNVPSTGTGVVWSVFELNNGVITPINTIGNSIPSLRAGDDARPTAPDDRDLILDAANRHPKAGAPKARIGGN